MFESFLVGCGRQELVREQAESARLRQGTQVKGGEYGPTGRSRPDEGSQVLRGVGRGEPALPRLEEDGEELHIPQPEVLQHQGPCCGSYLLKGRRVSYPSSWSYNLLGFLRVGPIGIFRSWIPMSLL